MAVNVNEHSGEVEEPQIGRRERKKREIQQRIHRAAVDLFREKGYEATTVEEIAERADVAKGTVFNYYPRKEALLALVAEEMIEEVASALGPPESWRGTVQEKVRRFFLRMAEVKEENADLSRIIVFESMKHVALHAGDDPRQHRMGALLRSVLEEARERGEVRADVEIEQAAVLLESAYFASVVLWLGGRYPDVSLQQELSKKLDIIFYGLTPLSARAETRRLETRTTR